MRDSDQEQAAAGALSTDPLSQLPRYEGHLSRELDRSLARYRRLQQERLMALSGEILAAE